MKQVLFVAVLSVICSKIFGALISKSHPYVEKNNNYPFDGCVCARMNFFSQKFTYNVTAIAFKPRIAEGSYVDVENYPYQASLIHYGSDDRTYKEPICGASIISDQWIITAGHCLKDKTKEELKVKTGATFRYKDGEEHEIDEIIIHPDYDINYYTMSNDIGLIKLRKPIKISKVQKPISLAMPSDKPVPGKKLTVSGFGRESLDNEKKTPQLKATKLTMVSLDKCQEIYYFDELTDKILCAGTGPASTCNGDSGGPAVINGELVGIVSSGFRCDTIDVPAIFTFVGEYVDWISKCVKNQLVKFIMRVCYYKNSMMHLTYCFVRYIVLLIQ